MAPTLSPKGPDPVTAVIQPVGPEIGASLLPPDVWLYVCASLRLSDRELQIVQGIFAEQEPDSIARALDLSPEFVYRTTQRIYIKLRIGSRAELIQRVRSEYLAFIANQPQPQKVLRAG